MKVIVVGAGIAGLTTSLCLRERGHEVVLLERAEGLRGEGYMIDFFGSGFDAAERLGLIPALTKVHRPIRELAFVDETGHAKFALPYGLLRKRLFDDRHFNFLRGDLERVLFEAASVPAQIRFKAELRSVEGDASGVRASFSDGSEVEADLLVGADGVRSATRALAFEGEHRPIRYLGFHTAAFMLDDAELARSIGSAFATMTVRGRQVAAYPVGGGRVATFWVHIADQPLSRWSVEEARAELRSVYGDLDWIVPRLLEHADAAPSIYFDDVSQVEMPRWSTGRVVLVGDACGCVSLLAGQGASLALAGAYLLADAIGHEPVDLVRAFAMYEKRIAPTLTAKQKSARGLAHWFVPQGRVRLALRDAIVRRSTSPLAGWMVRRQLAGESLLQGAFGG